MLEGRYPPIGVDAVFRLASPQNDCVYGAICYAIYNNERYQYFHDIPLTKGTFVKLYEFPQESEASTECGTGSPSISSALSWQEVFSGENTATPEQPESLHHEGIVVQGGPIGGNTATPANGPQQEEVDTNSFFQAYAEQRAYQADLPDGFDDDDDDTWAEEEWEELVDALSFHTSVFGFEKLNAETVAYYDAFGVFPTFEILFVNGQLVDSSFQFQGQNWNRQTFVAAVRLFMEHEIARQEFSAVAFVNEIPTPYEQRGADHIYIIVERSYAPLRIMICVVVIFDMEDDPEIRTLSVPQYVWSKDLVRDLRMEGVCRDPRFDCLLRHGLLEMPTVVAWQPFQGMKLNLDIKMSSCDRQEQRYHIMTSLTSVINTAGRFPVDHEIAEDVVTLMQQGNPQGNESELPTMLSTQRDDTESLCNGYSSRGPTDIIAPHFVNQAQQIEELREWLVELLGSDASVTLFVFERNDGDVSTYRISLNAEVLRMRPGFAHWLRRELAALWNVHARIFPLVSAPFADLRIAVFLPRAFGRDLPVLLGINDGHDSWGEIHVVQQAVTINSLISRSRLPSVVLSTYSYQAMLVGEMAEPNDLAPWSPGQWVTIAVGQLGYLGGEGTTDSFIDPWLPTLTSLATSHTVSSRTDGPAEDANREREPSAGEEHTLMQLPSMGYSHLHEVHAWML